jgi:hypothetical protein
LTNAFKNNCVRHSIQRHYVVRLSTAEIS